MSVIDALSQGARSEAQNLKEFVTTPTGIFETADKIIRTARSTVRQAASAVGVPTVFGQRRFRGSGRLRGQLSGARLRGRIRRRY